MKIIREKSSNVVIYGFSDAEHVHLSVKGLQTPTVQAMDIRRGTHEVLENVTPPDLFVPGAMAYDNGWTIIDQEIVDRVLAERAAAARDAAKRSRQASVDAITVTTQAGNTFDGDETSQGRMARAIIALQATGTPTVTWVLADNTVIDATVAELTEALALAGAAQAALWVI